MDGDIIIKAESRPELIYFEKRNDGSIYLAIDPFYPKKEDIKQILDICQKYLTYTDFEIEEKNQALQIKYEKEREEIFKTMKEEMKTGNKRQRDDSGFIYLLQDKEGRVKIGKAKSLTNRVFNVGILLPHKPTLIHSFKTYDTYLSEKELHDKYSEQRLNGEWFKLSKKQIEEIKSEYKDEE